MFTYTTTIRLHHTDAAGIVYFARYFELAHEAYEAFLSENGLHLGRFLKEASYLIPVVQASCQYLTPLYTGDVVRIRMRCDFTGNSSFSLHFRLEREETLVAEVHTTHVTVSRTTGQKIPLPEALLTLLEGLRV